MSKLLYAAAAATLLAATTAQAAGATRHARPARPATEPTALAPVTVTSPGGPEKPADYRLGPGDLIKIQVYSQPDMTVETRVSESGIVNYPLVGRMQLGGLTIADAENRIAQALKRGQVLKSAHVNINLVQVRGNQVTVIGQVSKPGRFPLETMNTRVSDALAAAGGVAATGGDMVVVTGWRKGKAFRKEIDLPMLFANKGTDDDILLGAGDTLYVAKAPVYYIYGEAQKPGPYRVERGMTVMQAIAQGGGITPRGSQSRLKLTRTQPDGKVVELRPGLTDTIQPGDVLFVRESIF